MRFVCASSDHAGSKLSRRHFIAGAALLGLNALPFTPSRVAHAAPQPMRNAAPTGAVDLQVGQCSESRFGRELLTANRTFYVSTNGSDTNDGSASDAAQAFRTVQGAINYILHNIDSGEFRPIVQLAPGTYDGSVYLDNAQSAFIMINGDTSQPGRTVLVSDDDMATVHLTSTGVKATIQGVKISNSGAGFGIRIADGANGYFGANVYGRCGKAQIAFGPSGHVYIYADYEIDGNAPSHFYGQGNATCELYGNKVILTETPVFSDSFALMTSGAVLQTGGVTYRGSAKGKRYAVSGGAGIDTHGGGPNYFPGDIAGTADPTTYGYYK